MYKNADQCEIREAKESEDYLISIILANAFLKLWNHNWFHQKQAIDSLPLPSSGGGTLPQVPRLTTVQERRRRFYHAIVKLVRASGGSVLILLTTASSSTADDNNEDHHRPEKTVLEDGEIGAVLLWQPPHLRPTFWHLLTSGFLNLAIWDYGLRSAYRIEFIFEGNVAEMFKMAGVDERQYHFVQMLGTNPEFKGYGYGRHLLASQIERCRCRDSESSGCGVILDTTTESAIKVYESLGFEVLGERKVDTGTDRHGIALRTTDEGYTSKKAEADRICRQRVMKLDF